MTYTSDYPHTGSTALIEENERLRSELRAIELAVDGLNTKGFMQKAETQGALDRIKAHCRAALSPKESVT